MKIILMGDPPTQHTNDEFFNGFVWENFQDGDPVWLEDWPGTPAPCAICLAGDGGVFLWPATYAEGEQSQSAGGHYIYSLQATDNEADDLKEVCTYWTLQAALAGWVRLEELGYERIRIRRTVKNQDPYGLTSWFYTREAVEKTLEAYNGGQ
jgi:hypothetical protein